MSSANNAPSTVPNTADVIIVGAGIWGLSTAYHLAKSRAFERVVIVERNADLADETTRQAAGQIGQLRSHPVMARAVGYTLELLTSFARETGHDPGLRTPGSLHVALYPERREAFAQLIKPMAALGVRAEFVDKAVVQKLAPAIDITKINGALFVPGDGYVDARQTALAYGAAARDLGVSVHLGVAVEDFLVTDDTVRGVRTDASVIEAGHVVVTAGPWTALLAERAGFRVPVCGLRLQQARTVADPALPRDHPVVRIPDHSCYLRPEQGGYLYGYFDPEPLLLDPRERGASFRTQQVDPQSALIDEARQRLGPVFPILERLAIDEYRQGMVTCAPDGWYVLGPVPERRGLWLATGCAGMGIAGSGAVGKWLAQWIATGDPDEDLSLMRPERFAEHARDVETFQQTCRRTFANYYSLRGGATYRDSKERET